MKSPHGFLVTPNQDKLYRNTERVGSVEFILSASIEEAKVVNREALVTSIPSGYTGEIKDGAIIIVHHNVFRKTFAMDGQEKFSSDLVTENTYLVPPESVYAYKNPDQDNWESTRPWCFVRPTGEKLHGEVVFGPRSGCEVVFIPDSEYEFKIDGEVLYRIDTNDICLKKDHQES